MFCIRTYKRVSGTRTPGVVDQEHICFIGGSFGNSVPLLHSDSWAQPNEVGTDRRNTVAFLGRDEENLHESEPIQTKFSKICSRSAQHSLWICRSLELAILGNSWTFADLQICWQQSGFVLPAPRRYGNVSYWSSVSARFVARLSKISCKSDSTHAGLHP